MNAPTLQDEHQAATSGDTQNERVLNCLIEHAGSWVAMPVLWRASGAFAVHSRISDLRRLGHTIDHRCEVRFEGARRINHSFYRLNPAPSDPSDPSEQSDSATPQAP